MKSILILILFPVVCWGQNPKQQNLSSPNVLVTKWVDVDYSIVGSLHDSTSVKLKWANAKGAHRDEMIITPKQDTIPVIMLVCDTASKVMLYNKWVAQWQFGYEVRFYNTFGQAVYFEYLDEKKKWVGKNIVVWISKEIK